MATLTIKFFCGSSALLTPLSLRIMQRKIYYCSSYMYVQLAIQSQNGQLHAYICIYIYIYI